MKQKERYQSEKTKNLRKINRRKDRLIKIIGFPIVAVTLIFGIKHISSLPNIFDVAFSSVGLITAMFAEVFTMVTLIDNKGYEREQLINKLNAEEEWNKLEENEKLKVKELSNNTEVLKVAKKIRNLDLKEKDFDLLKDAVLNKNIVAFMNNTDKKKCFKTAFTYKYDENLELEYQESTKNKTKLMIKSIKNTFNKNK